MPWLSKSRPRIEIRGGALGCGSTCVGAVAENKSFGFFLQLVLAEIFFEVLGDCLSHRLLVLAATFLLVD